MRDERKSSVYQPKYKMKTDTFSSIAIKSFIVMESFIPGICDDVVVYHIFPRLDASSFRFECYMAHDDYDAMLQWSLVNRAWYKTIKMHMEHGMVRSKRGLAYLYDCPVHTLMVTHTEVDYARFPKLASLIIRQVDTVDMRILAALEHLRFLSLLNIQHLDHADDLYRLPGLRRLNASRVDDISKAEVSQRLGGRVSSPQSRWCLNIHSISH